MPTPHKLPTPRCIAISLALLGLLLIPALAAADTTLPDNRAWELVSPLNKNGGEIRGISGVSGGGVVQSSLDGNTITYATVSAFDEPKGAPIGSQYIAKRAPAGWSTQNITSPTTALEYGLAAGTPYKAFSQDLTSALQLYGELPRPASIQKGAANFYLRNNETDAYQPLLTTPPTGTAEEPLGPGQYGLLVPAVSPDLKHITLETSAVLAPGGTYNGPSVQQNNLYEWTDGQFQPINILPGVTNGETSPEHAFLGGEGVEEGMVSNDGAIVFWTMGGSHQKLLAREDIGTPGAHTVQIDDSHGPGASGVGEFLAGDATGSRAFFTDREQLTSAPKICNFAQCEDLYEFNTDTNEPTDLTVDDNPEDVVPGTSVPGGAQVQGVLGASADGSYVYFVALGAHLASAEPNAKGEQPVSGADNLYVYHAGGLKFIATLSESEAGDIYDWQRDIVFRTARVTPDGLHAVFDSDQDLTGYDSEGNEEVYEYDANSESLACASCNPSGAAPDGPSEIPGGTGNGTIKALYQSRVLTDEAPSTDGANDGVRVFFDSSDALVPQDNNGHQDVYEWEADGTGSCRSESQNGGCVSLISGGTSNSDSAFVDASANGSDVFFITGQELVSQDNDGLIDLYDARENGGITQPPAPPVCSGTGCQGVPPAPPIFATPSSVTFNGVGNFEAPAAKKPAAKAKKAKPKPKVKGCKKGLVRKRGRCVRKVRTKTSRQQ